jgi:N-acetylglucosaminyl-diphospho-decaprenol L-rhamnosyltransferase
MVRVHHESARRFLRAKYRGWWLWPVRAGLSAALRVRAAWVVRRTR